MTPFILLLLGLLLIFIEFYMPGLIIGSIGGVMVLTSIVLFAQQSNSPVMIVLFVIGTGAALILLVRFAIRQIPRARPGYSIYLHKDQTGYYASSFDASAIGKTGVVLSDLKPGGYIVIDGKKQQAISQSGYITAGSHVIVIGGQEESLIVRLKNLTKEEPHA